MLPIVGVGISGWYADLDPSSQGVPDWEEEMCLWVLLAKSMLFIPACNGDGMQLIGQSVVESA